MNDFQAFAIGAAFVACLVGCYEIGYRQATREAAKFNRFGIDLNKWLADEPPAESPAQPKVVQSGRFA